MSKTILIQVLLNTKSKKTIKIFKERNLKFGKVKRISDGSFIFDSYCCHVEIDAENIFIEMPCKGALRFNIDKIVRAGGKQ